MPSYLINSWLCLSTESTVNAPGHSSTQPWMVKDRKGESLQGVAAVTAFCRERIPGSKQISAMFLLTS